MGWNEIWTGDCVDLMQDVSPLSVDLLFADPPFNIGYEYDVYKDRRGYREYLDWTEGWLRRAVPCVSKNGSFWVAIGDEYAAEMKLLLDESGLTLRNWVVWHYTFGVACQNKFSRSHAHLFYYVADPDNFTFNADAVRIPSARLTDYEDKRANPNGKLPDDVWTMSRICGTFRERTGHPCQMPESVLERIIKACSNPGDAVLDPFAGSGTTPAVAKRLGRRYLGIELSPDYADAVRDRLADVREQFLL